MPEPTYYNYDVVVTRKLSETKTFQVRCESEETAAGAAIQHAKAATWSEEYEYVVDSTTLVPEEPAEPTEPSEPSEPPPPVVP